MVPVENNGVYSMALRVRHILDQLSVDNGLIAGMGQFPRGCCGSISQILARILIKYGYHVEDVVAANHVDDHNETHSWVDLGGGVSLDITGDQDGDRPHVFLGPEDEWFCKWARDSAGGITSLNPVEKELFDRIVATLEDENSSSEEISGD